MFAVDGEAGRIFASGDRPGLDHRGFFRVDAGHFMGVFDVHEDRALPVGGGKLGLAGQRDVADHGVFHGIDGGGVLAASVKGEDPFAGFVVEDRVGILRAFQFDACGFLERLKIEDRDGVLASVAGEALAQVLRQRDTVDARRVGDVTHHRALVGIDHHHVCAARDEQPLARGIEGQIVPAAVAAQRELLFDVELRLGRGGSGKSHR